MQKTVLKAVKRELVGKKVKNLRKQGIVPANLFGKKIKSQSLSIDKKEFDKVFDQAGETGIVELSIEGDKETHPVMIQNLQKHPVNEEILHVDLRQVILTEKITANIPVEMTGEAPAATQKLGILIQNVSEIEVEALPLDLPEKFTVDVSKLANVGDQITVAELSINKEKVEIKVTEDLVIAKIEPLAAEEAASVVAVPTEGEAATADGEVKPTEGQTPAEEVKTEESKE